MTDNASETAAPVEAATDDSAQSSSKKLNIKHSEDVIQSMPALSDDILLEIFANLDVGELNNLAQCCRRFESLALTTFETVWDGWLYLDEDTINRLRIFGSSARHVFCVPPKNELLLQWPQLNLENLESMDVDVSQIHDLCQQNIRFNQVERLVLRCKVPNAAYDHIKFGQCFPKLNSLNWELAGISNQDEQHLPRGLKYLKLIYSGPSSLAEPRCEQLLRLNSGLRVLKMDTSPMRMNKFIRLIVRCNVHLTLESFSFETGVLDAGCLSWELLRFQKLKKLSIRVLKPRAYSVSNSLLFQQMAHLRSFTFQSM